jgi:hypothetical protein
MIFISPYITNTLFLITCYLAGYQHVQLYKPNPLASLQFAMIVFCLLMMLGVAFYNDVNPWLSFAFLVIAIVSLVWMIREHRMLPPRKSFE